MINQKEIQTGIRVEMEHTNDERLAYKICMDHLREDPRYYTKLQAAGLEQEGAMTNQERGMEECGVADVAIIKIGGNGVGQAPKSGEATPAKPLTSSNLGAGAPKPLTSTGLQAPKGDNIVPGLGKTPAKMGGKDSSMGDLNVKGGPISDEEGNEKPNNVQYGKTPEIAGSNSNSDAMDFFGGQISKALKADVPRRMEFIPTNVSEGFDPNELLRGPDGEKVFKFYRYAGPHHKDHVAKLIKAGNKNGALSFIKQTVDGFNRDGMKQRDDAMKQLQKINEGGSALKKK